ncbi:acyl-CoA carboxylase epsilon subunit [Agromyces sp. MMS24-JH15]|uniref:acyl-CoA carboxylase epsilon subunit n=1 Tax=Agromyces sp. MMS24-JH15 TaxID=3243765 RepID=UPI0037496326
MEREQHVDPAEGAQPDLRILTPGVTDDEAAAATAVVAAAIRDQRSHPPVPAGTDGWVRAARPHRTPFDTGPGRWSGNFR